MGQSLKEEQFLQPRADVQEELVGDELFLHRPEQPDAVHCLNSGATLIWLLCDGTRDEAGVAQELSEAYRLPKSDMLADVRSTVIRLRELGLLEPSQGEGHA